jgi:hypothetical protein
MSSKFWVIGLVFASSSISLGWGGVGHNTICMVASQLVQEPELAEFLKNKSHVMGHLCNIPDTYWRDLGPAVGALNGPTHYVDVDLLSLKISEIPEDYKVLRSKAVSEPKILKKTSIKDFHKEFGSNWWRADQLYRLAVGFGKKSKADSASFSDSVYQFFVHLGLMGHFVGDNSQPFHLTMDYDGFAAGHGGIHSYYEDDIVAEMGIELFQQVHREAKKMLKRDSIKSQVHSFLQKGSVLFRMKKLAEISFSEIPDVLKLDPVIKPSTQNSEKGMKLKQPAQRLPAVKIYKKFEKLITLQQARAAALLAVFWDEAFIEAGRPSLKNYRSYQFPFQPEFVKPDYLNP